MQNIKQLTENLIDNYTKMKEGKMDIELGKELANTAGKILKSVKMKMDYNELTKNNNKIEFLED